MRSKGLFLAERNPLLRPVIQSSLSLQFHLEMSLPQAGWRMVLVPFDLRMTLSMEKHSVGVKRVSNHYIQVLTCF